MSPVEAFLGMFLLLLIPILEGMSKIVYKFESTDVSYKITRTPEKNFAKVHEPFQVCNWSVEKNWKFKLGKIIIRLTDLLETRLFNEMPKFGWTNHL